METINSLVQWYRDTPLSEMSAEEQQRRCEEMRLGRSGPLIDRTYRESPVMQFLRELVQNAIESGAKNILVMPDWVYVQASGNPENDKDLLDWNKQPKGTEKNLDDLKPNNAVYRFSVMDDGCGMDAQELKTFFTSLSLSGGGKDMGTHDNFGQGAKVSTMPGNPFAIYVMSWRDGVGRMIRLFRRDDGEYGLWRWEADDGYHEVIDTPDEYDLDALKAHKDDPTPQNGTLFICAGDAEDCDTIHGFPGRPFKSLKSSVSYLNRRYFQVPAGVNLRVYEFSNRDKRAWPQSFQRSRQFFLGQLREHKGQKANLDAYAEAHGVVKGRKADIHWWVIRPDDEDDPKTPSLSKLQGSSGYGGMASYVGVLYKNEIYDVNHSPARFRQFGVFNTFAREHMVLIVEPKFTEDSGVAPNNIRSNLVNLDSPGDSLPWHLWGAAFAKGMPAPVKKLIEDNDPIEAKDAASLMKTVRFRAAKMVKDWLGPDRRTVAGGDATKTRRKGANGKKSGKNGGTHKRTIPKVQWDFDDHKPERPVEMLGEKNEQLRLFWHHPAFQRHYQWWCRRYEHIGDSTAVESKVKALIMEEFAVSMAIRVVHATSFNKVKEWKGSEYEMLLSKEALMLGILGTDLHRQIGTRLAGLFGRSDKTPKVEEEEAVDTLVNAMISP